MLGTSHPRSDLATQSPEALQTLAPPALNGADCHVSESSLTRRVSTANRIDGSSPRPATRVDKHPNRHAARSVGILGAAHFTNDIYGSVLPAMLPVMLPVL